MLELLDKLSLAVGHTARLITVVAFFALTAAISVGSISFLVSMPFEYSFGQDDLSLADVIALALLAAVTWRYFRRGRQSGAGSWNLIKRFSFSITFTSLILLSAIGVFACAAIVDPDLVANEETTGFDDLFQYGLFAVFITAIYGSTLLPPILSDTTKANAGSPNGHQPSAAEPGQEAEPPTLQSKVQNIES